MGFLLKKCEIFFNHFYWPFLVNNDQAEFGKNDENHN